MNGVFVVKEAVRRIIVVTIIIILCVPAVAQQESKKQTFGSKIIGSTKNFIENILDGKDTLYVSPNRYNLTIMPQYTFCYEYYRFSALDGKQSIMLAPANRNKIGVYLGWRWIFLGYSFDLGNEQPQTDLNFSFYTAAAGIDLFYRKRDSGYRIRELRGFFENDTELTNYNRNFDGLAVEQLGLNLYYIFNHKRFSYPAAYSQSTNQRISAGSFILGITYNEQSFNFDHSKFDPSIENRLDNSLKFRNINYKDFSINFGYSYNWVFAKDFVANLSLTPAVGYKNTSLRLTSSKELFSSINFDLITRAAVVYNNSRYYAGVSLVSHTYSYDNASLSIVNGFGVINVYFGFNFWRKK